MNPTGEVLEGGVRLHSECQLPKETADYRLKITLLLGSGRQVLLWIRDVGGEETKGKGRLISQAPPRMASLRLGGGRAVLTSSFLPSTGGQGSEQRPFPLAVGKKAGFSEAGRSV